MVVVVPRTNGGPKATVAPDRVDPAVRGDRGGTGGGGLTEEALRGLSCNTRGRFIIAGAGLTAVPPPPAEVATPPVSVLGDDASAPPTPGSVTPEALPAAAVVVVLEVMLVLLLASVDDAVVEVMVVLVSCAEVGSVAAA